MKSHSSRVYLHLAVSKRLLFSIILSTLDIHGVAYKENDSYNKSPEI